jgi:predicted phage gp36 major capsid-like protein
MAVDEQAEAVEALRAENALLRRVIEAQRAEIDQLSKPAARVERDPTRYAPTGRKR